MEFREDQTSKVELNMSELEELLLGFKRKTEPAKQPDATVTRTTTLKELTSQADRSGMLDTAATGQANITIDKKDSAGERKERTQRLHYAHGKQEEVMEQEEVEKRYNNAYLDLQQSAYFFCLDYTGARKSEIYELPISKFKLTPTAVELDIFRKKHSAQTSPIALQLDWFGVDKIVEWYKKRIHGKPSLKTIYIFNNKLNPPCQKVKKSDLWMFPTIGKGTALAICKKVYGDDKYAHYARLNRLTKLGSNPEASLVMLKSFSGIKSMRALEHYMGTSKKQLDKAIDLIGVDAKKK